MSCTARSRSGPGSRTQAPFQKLKPFPAIVFSLLFLVLSTINMLVYRGGHATEYLGTAYDFGAYLRNYEVGRVRYSFLLNFVSDLGRVRTYQGNSNLESASIFCLTLCCAGLGFFLYFRRLSIPGLPKEVEEKFAKPTRVLGQTSALAFAGIGWAPLDGSPLTFAMHMIFVNVAFGTVMGVCILMSILIIRAERYPMFCAFLYMALFAVLTLFLGAMVSWGLARTFAGYLALTLGQKIIVYLLIGNMLIQGAVTFRLSSGNDRRRDD